MDSEVFFKVLRYLGTVIAFVFGFLGYVVGVRPKLIEITTEYNVGLFEGGFVLFSITALPLTYVYLKEKKKQKRWISSTRIS